MDTTNYYTILGVAPMSSTEQIQVEFRLLAIQNHPDKCGDDPQAAERFALMQEARRVLTNDVERPLYDDWLGGGLDVSFAEYKGMRERGGWHWKTEKQVGRLESSAKRADHSPDSPGQANTPSTSSTSASTQSSGGRPRFFSSRNEAVRRFRNNVL
ncbi:dnaJ homolog subfamily C member 12-like [Sycon ciliatum]|uniref:dnaJ homolog subfamily C member 12-like n=1 Tax=Sycon ciliatum TaxID=27933 RepID=UPI0020AEB71E|eukprot:scpid92946/ scgid10327/ DnaJ homolog subfamily C member 12; J domain-containing protein 1